MITRRRLLISSLAAVGALAAAGLIYESSPDHAQADPQFRFTILDDEDRAIIAAVAPVLLEGALSGRDAVTQVVRGTDIAIAGLPLEVRSEIRQLLGILRFTPTRMLIAGIWHPWNEAHPPEISRFLQSWRHSRIVQLRSAYDALHQLVLAAWYGNDASWPAIGYPGPPKVPA